MFVVNVMPNNSNANISLAYKTENKARAAYSLLQEKSTEHISVADDFGSDVLISTGSISHVVFIDVAKSQWREWEMGQSVEKVRATLGKRPALLAG